MMFKYIDFLKLLKKYTIDSGISIVIIFILSAVISLLVYIYSKSYYENRAKERFENRVQENVQHLKEHMLLYENVLRSGVGFFYGSDKVTRNDWHNFIEAVDIKTNYPGMQGIGFSMMLKPTEVPLIEQKMRQDWFDSFELKPKGKRQKYSAILYLEPVDKRNKEAIGYDMFSEPTRREAMQMARDTGLPAITRKVRLVQEIGTDVQAGMLMYLPVYKKGRKTDTIDERRKALKGFVYSPFRMNDMINKSGIQNSIMNLKIYDSKDMSDEHLLYDSFQAYSKDAKYKCFKALKIHNLTWHIRFSSTPKFDASTSSPYPLYITVAGMVINFLLLFIILALIKSLEKLQLQAKKNKEQTSYMLHQSRLAQMGEMVSMIAHQWRQPLSSISVISGTLLIDIVMEKYDQKFFSEQLESIDKLSQHLSSTIDDFRDFFKTEKKKKMVTTKKIIDETLLIIGSSFESKSIELIIKQNDDAKIYTHVNEVKQVVLNILKNSEEALVENKKPDPKIWIDWHLDDEYMHISIEDNAGGIPDKIINSVFEPYFSTKLDKDGTGLGLYMSKTIVEEHCGGILSVSNTENGAKFEISLPVSVEEDVESLL